MTGTFGYLFGDSMAKVGLVVVADPEKNGLSILGHPLHGWQAVFTVLRVSAIAGILMLLLVAYGEENGSAPSANRKAAMPNPTLRGAKARLAVRTSLRSDP